MRTFIGFVVWVTVMLWAGNVLAQAPIQHVIAFDTSTGTTKFSTQFTMNARTSMLAIQATGSDIFVTVDGTTTPLKDKHLRFTEDQEYLYMPSQGQYIDFTGDGVAAGWVNVIEYRTWAWPY